MLVVGPKEAEADAVSVRVRNSQETRTMAVGEFLATVTRKIADKDLSVEF